MLRDWYTREKVLCFPKLVENPKVNQEIDNEVGGANIV